MRNVLGHVAGRGQPVHPVRRDGPRNSPASGYESTVSGPFGAAVALDRRVPRRGRTRLWTIVDLERLRRGGPGRGDDGRARRPVPSAPPGLGVGDGGTTRFAAEVPRGRWGATRALGGQVRPRGRAKSRPRSRPESMALNVPRCGPPTSAGALRSRGCCAPRSRWVQIAKVRACPAPLDAPKPAHLRVPGVLCPRGPGRVTRRPGHKPPRRVPPRVGARRRPRAGRGGLRRATVLASSW